MPEVDWDTLGDDDASSGPDEDGSSDEGEDGSSSGDEGDDAVCGNGVVEAGEDCDDDGVATPGCDADCTFVRCGDGTVNVFAMETCDDGNDDDFDRCAACVPSAFTIHEGYAADLFPDVAVVDQEGDERFLVAYRDRGDMLLQTYAADGTVAWGPSAIATGQNDGMLDLIVGTEGNGLLLWHANTGDNWGVIRHQRFDANLQQVSSTGEWPVLSFGRHAIGAAGRDGGICTTGWFSSVPIGVRCFDAAGIESGGSEFPSTFGGMEEEGPHDLIPTDDGYVLVYIPDDVTHDVMGYPLSFTGELTGPGFVIADLLDPHWSWVPRGASLGGSRFVALTGELTEDGYGPWFLYYRMFDGAGLPTRELTLVDDTVEQKREGYVVAHESGRFLITWLGGVIRDPDTNWLSDCRVEGRLFDEDGEPIGETMVLHDPGPNICTRGLRGATDATGNVFLTWSNFTLNESLATQQALVLQGLLAPE